MEEKLAQILIDVSMRLAALEKTLLESGVITQELFTKKLREVSLDIADQVKETIEKEKNMS